MGSLFDKKKVIPVESIVDSKTGETVHRIAIAPEHIEDINKTIQKHQETMNAFVMNSQNFFIGLKIQLDLVDKIKAADEAIKKTLSDVQKKTEMDPKRPWVFNIALKTFEYREPPKFPTISNAEIKPIGDK